MPHQKPNRFQIYPNHLPQIERFEALEKIAHKQTDAPKGAELQALEAQMREALELTDQCTGTARVVWLAVIDQALRDFKNGWKEYDYHPSHKKTVVHRNHLNRAWFFSDEFKAICKLAEVRPAQVRIANRIY